MDAQEYSILSELTVINGEEYSNDLLEYSKGFSDESSENPKKGGNPNITVISESGLYQKESGKTHGL